MTFKKTVAWAAVALWMGLIFYLSSQPAVDSNQVSRGITEVMVRAIEKIAPGTLFETGGLNNFLRKSAHFSLFLCWAWVS